MSINALTLKIKSVMCRPMPAQNKNKMKIDLICVAVFRVFVNDNFKKNGSLALRSSGGGSDPVLFKDADALGDTGGRKGFAFGDLLGRISEKAFARNQCAESEHIGFDLLARSFSDAVKICRNARIRNVQKEMREFVEHYEKLFLRRQILIDGNVMSAQKTIIKTADAQRHFLHRYAKTFAKPVEILFVKRPFVPAAAKVGDLVEYESHYQYIAEMGKCPIRET